MKSSYMRGWRGGGGIRKVLRVACLLIYLDCGGVAGFHGSLFDYISFEETGEWNSAYKQTCRGRSHDDFREPRHVQYPGLLRSPHESKTPVPINTNEVLRENGSMANLTLHIYSNPGVHNGYSLSYGFQRNKECIHGQDSDCIVQRSFGGVRALVLNAERFKDGQDLNFIKDHFRIEEPERHVSILNGGSVNERKFYEAVFLGGYIPKALQSRGKSSHVIDGKSYPMEIYMYFVDETVPSMSLTTILVVLVEESEIDNPSIRPIVRLVNHKLYEDERKFLHNSTLNSLNSRELQFHNQGPSIKYDIFAKHKKKTEEQLRQERFKVSARLNRDLADQFEIFEKMQALDSELIFHDEDLKHAKDSLYRTAIIEYDFLVRRPKSIDFPYEYDELYLMGYLGVQLGAPSSRKRIYGKFSTLLPGKNELDLLTFAEWNNSGVYERLLAAIDLTAKNANRDPPVYLHNQLKDSTLLASVLSGKVLQDLCDKHFEQQKNLTFHVVLHGQKHMNWIERNRDQNIMEFINNTAKYQRVREYSDLVEERRLLNEDVYNHFFGNSDDGLHQWAAVFFDSVPDFQYTLPMEERKRTVMDSMINILQQAYRIQDYNSFISNKNATLAALAKSNHFPDEQTMREVIHHLKFGYKEFGKKARRNYAHDSYYKNRLPYQQKRQGPVELGNTEMSKKDSDEEAKLTPPKAIVKEAFQVSWLIPPNGGYYYYEGSSPVPPCYRAQNVIVFKKPINMSRHQIKTLTRVPIAHSKNLDIVHTTPVLHDTKFRVKLKTSTSEDIRYEEVSVPVYFQPRNHLFLGHDGVHKNAVEQYEKRQRKRQMEALNLSRRLIVGRWETALILVIGLAIVY